MSNSPHPTTHEHGTMQAYVTGFVLSLAFTLIPYYLVVHHTLAGTELLLTVLGFAVVQMVIQITFFLHLGRGPKPKWNVFFFVSTVGIILVVVGGSIVIINNLHYNMQPSEQVARLINGEGIAQIGGKQTGACYGQYANHQVIIDNGKAVPSTIKAAQCDTLTFSDEDNVVRDMTFGDYPLHEVYAGVKDLLLLKGQSQTITLSQPGTFAFHDHLHPQVIGSFTVKSN